MFSSLEARDVLRGANVLDLYAGSGALGLEAASRGAASVVLVERNAAAARVCRANTAVVARAAPPGAALHLETIVSTVHAYLSSASGGDRVFDLVFIDPPYELGDPELADELTTLVLRLAPAAVVVVERSTRSPEPAWPPGLIPDRHRVYGETAVWTAVRDTP